MIGFTGRSAQLAYSLSSARNPPFNRPRRNLPETGASFATDGVKRFPPWRRRRPPTTRSRRSTTSTRGSGIAKCLCRVQEVAVRVYIPWAVPKASGAGTLRRRGVSRTNLILEVWWWCVVVIVDVSGCTVVVIVIVVVYIVVVVVRVVVVR